MTTLSIIIVAVFCLGYFCIAIESVTKINKAAIALLMFVLCWTLFMIDPGQYIPGAIGEHKALTVAEVMERHLGTTATTLFFLMGAMTIVELVDQNG
ncbi:MAG: sodium:proton antiporter, partial [Prevotella sp.]